MSEVGGAMEAPEEDARAIVAKPNLTAPIVSQLNVWLLPKRQSSGNIMPNEGAPSRGKTKEDDTDAA